MNCYKVAAFFTEDLDKLTPGFQLPAGNIDETMAKTLLIDGEVKAAGGITLIWPGNGLAWAMIDRDIEKKHVRRIIELYGEHLLKLMDLHNIHRVQADVKSDFEKGLRFVKYLGFEYEGRMKAYGPDKEDYERFAFVRS